MLSRFFEDAGQIRWVHGLHAVCMSGCIHVDLDSYNVIFEAVMASDFANATRNGSAAQRYLLMVADMPGTGNGIPQT